ncbi:MAG: winged helix-turn-helix transcriptional regulator [Sciscionella sp.]
MVRNVRTYNHFCLLARALECVGDRWSLLVVRDLLSGAKRFTDLADRLRGITPKTLTQRLLELQAIGVVAADREPGRREVWYRLTGAGNDLGPAIDALSWWGMNHAWRPPRQGEPLHIEHLLRAITQVIERTTQDRAPARWHFRFSGDDGYLIECDGEHWSLRTAEPTEAPDVTVASGTDAWTQFVRDPAPEHAARLGIDIRGAAKAVRRFSRLLRAFPDSVAEREAGTPPESAPSDAAATAPRPGR